MPASKRSDANVKILVFLKQVPDTEAAIKIGADQKSVAEAGLKFIINPYDEYALEEALRIKEAQPGSVVKAITLGPQRCVEALRAAAAMGADEVLLLQTANSGIDSLAAARAMAAALQGQSFDLILMGKESIDDGNMQTGPMLAELLDLPCITVVTKLTLAGSSLTAECEGDEGVSVFETALPAIITCQKGINEPRYPSIRGKMTAMKMAIPEQPALAIDEQIHITGLAHPPARSGGKVVGEGAAAVPELVRLLHSEAKAL
jgi:electron transfer flavoprotein beta subunit